MDPFTTSKLPPVKIKWLEDFVNLAETRSCSRSAQLGHATQPAFSRRIQSLKAWAGVDLIDRSNYPTRLTPVGEALHAQALAILVTMQSARNLMRLHCARGQDVIEFAIPRALAFTFFPHWLMALRGRFGSVMTRLIALGGGAGAGDHLGNRHGRRPKGHGAGRPWPGLFVRQLGAARA